MSRPVVAILVFSILGWTQEPPTPSRMPGIDAGSVRGKTYKNASLGLELTPDPKLTFGSPELKGNGTVHLSLMVAALGEPRSGSAREGTFIAAVALAYFPEDQRSTDACMRRIVEANKKDGFKPVQAASEDRLGGTTFARTDFLKRGPAYEAVFVKACGNLALTFVFSGSDRDAVSKLIAGTDLKLDISKLGCRPKGTADTARGGAVCRLT